jgi:hypothetical protein
MDHRYLDGVGQIEHAEIDQHLPTGNEKEKLQTLAANAPQEVTGARDTPEEALANLLTALETLGLITDSTTVS